MSTFGKFSFLQLHVVSLLFVLPSFAYANTDLTYGSGPDGYRSYSIRTYFDLSRTVQLDFDYFLAKSTGEDYTREIGAGLNWYATELTSANYRYSVINDGRVEVKGNEGGLSFALDTLWQGELRTTVDLGYGEFKYKAANPQTIAASNFVLTQNRNSLGISQDISSFFTIYGSHDQYKYDKNLTLQNLLALNLPIIIRLRLAAARLSFPDKTNMLGMTWRMTDALSLDLSSAKTTTLFEQEQKSTRLGVDYQINNKLSVVTAVTRVSATAITIGSVTVQQATQDTYTDLSVGWGF